MRFMIGLDFLFIAFLLHEFLGPDLLPDVNHMCRMQYLNDVLNLTLCQEII